MSAEYVAGLAREIVLNCMSSEEDTPAAQIRRQVISHTVFEKNDRFHPSEFDFAATYKDEVRQKKEAMKKEAAKKETAKKEAVKKEAAEEGIAKKEAAEKEVEKEEAVKKEAVKKEAAEGGIAKREASEKEVEKKEAAKKNVAVKDPKSSLRLNIRCITWTESMIRLLQTLTEDIDATTREATREWSDAAVEEIVKLIGFLLDRWGLNQLDQLKEACREKERVPGNEWEASSGADLAKILEGTQQKAVFSFDVLKEKLSNLKKNIDFEKASSIHNEDTISAATLRELLIRQCVATRKDEILQAIATSLSITNISNVLPRVVPIKDDIHVWISRTITILVDTKTRMIFTGASQPACDNFDLLKHVTTPITRKRVGPSFATIIDHCSDDFQGRVIQEKSRHDNDNESYQRIIQRNYSAEDERSKIPGPDNDSNVLCYAFDGLKLEPKAPCIKCQSLYSKWFHGTLQVWDVDVRKIVRDPNKVSTRTYCAESVVAGKLYVLRKGMVALV